MWRRSAVIVTKRHNTEDGNLGHILEHGHLGCDAGVQWQCDAESRVPWRSVTFQKIAILDTFQNMVIYWDVTLVSNYTVTLIPKYLDAASHPRKWTFWAHSKTWSFSGMWRWCPITLWRWFPSTLTQRHIPKNEHFGHIPKHGHFLGCDAGVQLHCDADSQVPWRSATSQKMAILDTFQNIVIFWGVTLVFNYTVTPISKYLDAASHSRKLPFWTHSRTWSFTGMWRWFPSTLTQRHIPEKCNFGHIPEHGHLLGCDAGVQLQCDADSQVPLCSVISQKTAILDTFQNMVIFWNVTLISSYPMTLFPKYTDAASCPRIWQSWTRSGAQLHRDAASHHILLKSCNNFLINLKRNNFTHWFYRHKCKQRLGRLFLKRTRSAFQTTCINDVYKVFHEPLSLSCSFITFILKSAVFCEPCSDWY
jgi:hypothetical protein